MHIILFILLLIIAIVVFGLSILGFVLKTIFGIGRNSSRTERSDNTRQQSSDSRYNQGSGGYRSNDSEEEVFSENSRARNRHKKIFTQEDGEYVDFEEVKE